MPGDQNRYEGVSLDVASKLNKLSEQSFCGQSWNRSAPPVVNCTKICSPHQKQMEPTTGIGTGDLRFTKPLLYQLSYVGAKKGGGNMPSARKRATGMIQH